ncbi:protein fuzzy homolog [Centruroides sculpturatus]|uniref:protein fuzzy homolog n=1 Tax=Centruroides sculpturatus TaxID=218467 RepID=UPI000C6DCBCC|nr:protein fuzzy homolog [Centruroides sculpturatus]
MGKRPRSGLPPAVTTAHAFNRRRKMEAHLMAWTADGGVPLFTRRTGDVKALPFAAVGTLNGMHMFSSLHNSELLSTVTGDGKLLWRSYHKSVVLIIICSDDNACDSHIGRVLDNVFAAMVTCVGLDNLCNIQNVERLKRDLKVCYNLVDHILLQLDEDQLTVGDLIGVVDCILCHKSPSLQHCLESFVETAESAYGCLLVRGKIALATKKWWSLDNRELVLLSAYVNSSTKTVSRDIPIYLPASCPNVCNRLLTFQLTQGIELCVLCGPNISLSQLEEEIPKHWKAVFEQLKCVSSLHPRNFPTSVTIDRNILGFILIESRKRCICSVQPLEEDNGRPKDGKCLSLRRRQEILRMLYKMAAGTYFSGAEKANDADSSENRHGAREAYTCSEYYKSYILQEGSNQLYLLFAAGVATFAMRAVAHRTLKTLTSQKFYQI